ncbi:MAG TPA: DUF4040 domain-containing protein, partial [Saprospiraceae bacterium]|nr:DUF4040 domain-containing protein [Saprospiraceae bacterium]
MIFLITVLLILLLMVGAAIYAIVQKDLLFAVIASGVISLILSILFLILQAPDVALTEAAIGVALTTIIFIITIRNTVRYEDER